jgi:hypothetical protein
MSLATRVFDVSGNKLHGEVPTWLMEAIPIVQLNCGCSTFNNFTDNSLYCPTKSSMRGKEANWQDLTYPALLPFFIFMQCVA